VEMSTFGGIPLCNPGDEPCAGGAFELVDAARESEFVDVDAWQVQVIGGERFVVARGASLGSYDDAFRAALIHAQKSLDLLALRGGRLSSLATIQARRSTLEYETERQVRRP
jgi:hypothetical protein